MRLHRIGPIALLSWLLMLNVGLLAQRSDSAQALLRAARDRAEVDGDLAGAIEQYQTIVQRFATTERAIVVQALLGMADAHEQLGHREAATIYARIMREYADQRGAASAARSRLAALQPPAAPRASGPTCTKCVGPFFHSFTISPNGRAFGYSDADSNLMTRDLRTGVVTRLVGFPEDSYATRRFRARRATWSGDSRQVAYFFRDTDAPGEVKDRVQLRVLTTGSTAEARIVIDNPEFVYVFPAAWSPDAQSILVMLQRRDFTWQLAWVSATTGAVTVLRSLDWQFNEFRNGPELSPDGQYIVYATFSAPRHSPGPNEAPTSRNGGPGRSIHILAADGSRDEIVPAPARGFTSPVWTPDGSRILFLSDRDGSGAYDLWASAVREGRPVGLPSLVKASIGTNIALVGTTREGLLYYVQPESVSRRIVISDLGPSTSTTFAGATTGFAGSDAAWSADGSHLAWLRNGGRSLVIHELDTGREEAYALPADVVSAPAWQQDGSAVLLGFENADNDRGFTVAQVDLRAGEVRTLGTYAPPAGQTWSPQFTPAAGGTAIYVTATTEAGQTDVLAVDLANRTTTRVLSDVGRALRLKPTARVTVGQAVHVAPEVVPAMAVALRADGKSVALTLLKNQRSAYLVTVGVDGANYREVFGPVPGRQWDQTLVSRLGDPKWLHDDLRVAFGIQQDDLSWKLMRVADDGRVAPLGAKNSGDFTLDPSTLRFDISPDGKRVAHERLMTFSDELWALDLKTLLPPPGR